MNIFRFLGDMTHVASIIVLLLRLQLTKNAQGISLRTNELFLLVFATRYLDLFTTYYSLYNSVMKVMYIAATGYIVHLVRNVEPICGTYDKSQDTFLHWKFLVEPCAGIAFLTNLYGGFNLFEMLWVFSIYLESVAILPQLIVLQRYGECENLTSHYIALLGSYRGLYIINWIYRWLTEPFYQHHYVVYFCGVLQTALYCDFFYYYVQFKRNGGKFSLPSAHSN